MPESAIRLLILALSVLVVYARTPILLHRPRFWAEEAVVYFRLAWEGPWLAALAAPHNGYLSLVNNVTAAFAANLVPLERAPLVTTLAALLCQLAPIAIILFGRIPLLAGLPRQAVAVLIVLLTPPSAEVWLNTINSQFHLALATGLLLLEDGEIPSRAGRILRRCLLAAAGLTGFVSCFLAPLALHRAWATRRREPIIQAGILCAAAALQLSILGTLGERSTAAERRGSVNVWTTATTLMTRTVIEPLLGSELGARISSGIVAYRRTSRVHADALGVALAAGLLALLACLLWQPRRRGAAALAGAYLLIAVLSIAGSLTRDKAALISVSHVNGGRYFYAPAVLMSLLVLSALAWNGGTFARMRTLVCGALLALSLVTNARHFRDNLLVDPRWPDWAVEIAGWRGNPSRELRVWPPGWTLKLDPVRSPR
jgi:hypothetical protein